MEKNKQKEAFLAYEADAWFERNKEPMLAYSIEKDEVAKLMKVYDLSPKTVLEIGCSMGHRINGLKNLYPDCEFNGIEPSPKAVAFGKTTFKSINLVQGTADNLEMYEDESMDVVIVGFILYVVDRNILFKVISEISRVLKNGGDLIIVDFFSEIPRKNQYQHIKEFSAFSFKQNYEEIFTASKLYLLLNKLTLSHTTGKLDAGKDYYNNYSISLLKKDIDASYQ